MKERHSIAWVVSVPGAVRAFVAPYISALSADVDVTLYCNVGDESLADILPPSVEIVPIELHRPIHLYHDVRCLWKLYWAFRQRRHGVVHSLLPKAGLLGMTAAWAAGVEHRIHLFTGQVWATKKGAFRAILKAADRFLAGRATVLFADSHSQAQFLRSEGVAETIEVIGPGSVSGLDSQRFRPNPEARGAFRAKLGLSESDIVIGFLGRLNRDKGVPQLIEAFKTANLGERYWLLLVGPDEEGSAAEVSHPQIRIVGPTRVPEHALATMDLFVLPSFREGFGMSVLEASAVGMPVIASRIYGLTDAVIDGETGWLVPPGDIRTLSDALREKVENPAALAAVGQAGRRRVVRDFQQHDFIAAMRAYYHRLLDVPK